MSTLVILNTVPCYYRNFDDLNEAYRFGFMMKMTGDVQGDNFRFKVLENGSKLIKNERINGYKLQEMNDSLYNQIVGEIRNANTSGILHVFFKPI